MPYIAPIVEGHGEIEAVPALLHRIAQTAVPGCMLQVNAPFRVKAGSFLNDEAYFRKTILLVGGKAKQAGGFVLILLDCEDDCPAHLGPSLLERARGIRDDVSYLVVLAYREYESWFLTAVSSLRGLRGLPHDLEPPGQVEEIRDAKGWLAQYMSEPYDPLAHQVEFSRKLDLETACANPSFRRFYERLTTALASTTTMER